MKYLECQLQNVMRHQQLVCSQLSVQLPALTTLFMEVGATVLIGSTKNAADFLVKSRQCSEKPCQRLAWYHLSTRVGRVPVRGLCEWSKGRHPS